MEYADVPVDAFWSISVYNAKGYFEPNKENAYSLNNITAKKSDDGSVTVQFGGALGFFKDWTNYLLVTTVAALGWIATKPVLLSPAPLRWTIACFCLSIICAIFTLALIPIVGEGITPALGSFYDVPAKFQLFWLWGPELEFKLKWVCWPQHVFFLAGIIIFSAASVASATCPKPSA